MLPVCNRCYVLRVGGPLWVVDYDIPVESKARRMAFYRGLWKILEENRIVRSGKSTQSVWIIDDEKIARQIHEHAESLV
jgi:hypothetical protein